MARLFPMFCVSKPTVKTPVAWIFLGVRFVPRFPYYWAVFGCLEGVSGSFSARISCWCFWKVENITCKTRKFGKQQQVASELWHPMSKHLVFQTKDECQLKPDWSLAVWAREACRKKESHRSRWLAEVVGFLSDFMKQNIISDQRIKVVPTLEPL